MVDVAAAVVSICLMVVELWWSLVVGVACWPLPVGHLFLWLLRFVFI